MFRLVIVSVPTLGPIISAAAAAAAAAARRTIVGIVIHTVRFLIGIARVILHVAHLALVVTGGALNGRRVSGL